MLAMASMKPFQATSGVERPKRLRQKIQIGSNGGRQDYQSEERAFHPDDVPKRVRMAENNYEQRRGGQTTTGQRDAFFLYISVAVAAELTRLPSPFSFSLSLSLLHPYPRFQPPTPRPRTDEKW